MPLEQFVTATSALIERTGVEQLPPPFACGSLALRHVQVNAWAKGIPERANAAKETVAGDTRWRNEAIPSAERTARRVAVEERANAAGKRPH
jgi:hypothetical protein